MTITSSERACLHVSLEERSYDIHIGPGLLVHLPELMAPYLFRKKTAIVTDENVASLHLKSLEQILFQKEIGFSSIILPPGEGTKSYAYLSLLCDQLLSSGIERHDLIVAFGGGVIGDLAGFAASILRRGVEFVQIPTTLLAQVDSSVGGKTGINSPLGKNLIGTFHQPKLVLCDTDVLTTLPMRERRAGYAEIVKYALLGDLEFFTWLEHHADAVVNGGEREQIQAIRTSCAMKAKIVTEDERENGKRALLNLGHTFGHAFEAAAGYGEALLHGEAVGLGLAMAFRFSEFLGYIDHTQVARVEAHLQKMGFVIYPSDLSFLSLSPTDLLALMKQDKKTKNGQITFILPRIIGQAHIIPGISETTLLSFLTKDFSLSSDKKMLV